jgi:predicted GNAT family N-acyltransferase
LLFVAPDRQGRGIARQLLRTAAVADDLVAPITVNASLNAVSFYAALGFIPEGPELLKNDVRHQPMCLAALPANWSR